MKKSPRIKNVALDADTYERLAALRAHGQSFSGAVQTLLDKLQDSRVAA